MIRSPSCILTASSTALMYSGFQAEVWNHQPLSRPSASSWSSSFGGGGASTVMTSCSTLQAAALYCVLHLHQVLQRGLCGPAGKRREDALARARRLPAARAWVRERFRDVARLFGSFLEREFALLSVGHPAANFSTCAAVEGR